MHISRRGLSVAGLGALAPSLAWAQAAPFPIAAWHDRTSADHGQETSARATEGFAPFRCVSTARSTRFDTPQ